MYSFLFPFFFSFLFDILIEPLVIVLQSDERTCRMVRRENDSPDADDLFLYISNSGSAVPYFIGATQLSKVLVTVLW